MAQEVRTKTERPVVFFDLECFRNYFYVGFLREDGKALGYEFSDRADFDRRKVYAILKKYTVVGFNSRDYDMMVLLYALSGASNAELKALSDDIIKNRLKPWDVERKYGVTVPKYVDHVDLFDTNPSVGTGSDDDDGEDNQFASGSASLKTLAGRMHAKRLQDLPVHEAKDLTHEEMDILNDYCLNSDCVATRMLYEHLSEALALREAMGDAYQTDFRSLSDAQMGERMIKIGVERLTGERIQKAEFKGAYTFRYKVPDFIRFETPLMQAVLKTIAETDIHVTDKGSVPFPPEFKKFKIVIDGNKYTLGIGGLHSTEKSRSVRSDNEYQIVDWDVGSQYPSIILKLGMFPKAVGPKFQPVYGGIKADRMVSKHLSKEAFDAGDKVLGEKHKLDSDGKKVGLNGPYGKLGSRYSILFAPHLMIGTTLTGQLTLLMFIERASLMGIETVSANTDGVVLRVPRHLYNGFVMKNGKPTERAAPGPLADLVAWWENLTSFEFEGAEYEAIYSRDVNYYLAIKPGGKVKRKGSIANHWHKDSPDYSIREMLKKNPNMTVLGDAIVAFLTKGTPIEEFIRSYTDVRGFVRVIKAKGGGDWKGQYLGKTVRFYWAKDGDRIQFGKPHETTGNRKTVQKSDGCRPLMTLPDDYAVPDDLDYARYIAEAYNILEDIGYGKRGSSPLEIVCERIINNKRK